ncbi:hypothetical protein RJT34_22073 [Clitoria ternatea]|uniref:Uncharacterized protein n=1 Tax=Clitoria ternatea TaxID=43366 RepID=A0AAN9IUW3_CLITE
MKIIFIAYKKFICCYYPFNIIFLAKFVSNLMENVGDLFLPNNTFYYLLCLRLLWSLEHDNVTVQLDLR